MKKFIVYILLIIVFVSPMLLAAIIPLDLVVLHKSTDKTIYVNWFEYLMETCVLIGGFAWGFCASLLARYLAYGLED